MKKLAIALVTLLAVILLTACKSKEKNTSIEGLWLVEKVQMGAKEITPIARWTRFNANYTQSSGNGWLQHSVGSWNLNKNKLSIENSNGISDSFEPFQVSVEGEKMVWKRKEEKDTVRVFLKKIQELPTSKGNYLFGLWKLISHAEKGMNVISKSDMPESAMIHFRWDNVYVQHNMPRDKRMGVYKIHGHKPEIQMINYGEGNSFEFWKFEISNDTLTMISTDNTTEIIFKRSHQFPQ